MKPTRIFLTLFSGFLFPILDSADRPESRMGRLGLAPVEQALKT